MRILFLGNNWVAWKIAELLQGVGEEVVGLVLHPPARRRYGTEIINSVGVDGSRIFDGSQLHRPDVLEAIKGLKPEIGISALFGYILRKNFLELMPAGCVNIHPAWLPYNRGAYPNVWSIVEKTPAGVTLHYIDEGVDTGDIIAQKQVAVDVVDTGGTLYRKLELAAVDLFQETWPLIVSGRAPRISQHKTGGTFHFVRDVEDIERIDLDRTYTARELIDILRARTFPPYTGSYFYHEGQKIYLRLQLFYEEEPKNYNKVNETNDKN